MYKCNSVDYPSHMSRSSLKSLKELTITLAGNQKFFLSTRVSWNNFFFIGSHSKKFGVSGSLSTKNCKDSPVCKGKTLVHVLLLVLLCSTQINMYMK